MFVREYPCFVLRDGQVGGFSAAYFLTRHPINSVHSNQIIVAKSLNGARHELRELSKLTNFPFYDESVGQR
ncbi:hypothetical protein [Snodgrassella sp. CFCC 13594]|uniref:hypothetical protein n=1 Tax=Snodgrassella sp. CFCC 13594 TaxID=1775559 RepID=UPI00083707D1|nr:hypothetical protein [Snodgrassella sp. CFCC 13594]